MKLGNDSMLLLSWHTSKRLLSWHTSGAAFPLRTQPPGGTALAPLLPACRPAESKLAPRLTQTSGAVVLLSDMCCCLQASMRLLLHSPNSSCSPVCLQQAGNLCHPGVQQRLWSGLRPNLVPPAASSLACTTSTHFFLPPHHS